MKINRLSLYTDQLEAQQAFFTQTLQLPLLSESSDQFTVQLGWTHFTFVASESPHPYHYCLLIPSNQLIAARDWLAKRTDLITDETGATFFHYESWNADAFYFYDAVGNVAECIVRYDLNNAEPGPFDEQHFLCVNEIGLGTPDTTLLHQFLEELGSSLWKGNKVRFGVNGTQEGLFLLPNYQLKPTWFPTEVPVLSSPLFGEFEIAGKSYELVFESGKLSQVNRAPDPTLES